VEDLWAFNEEPVARAIAACPIPVISAVGHEVDVTISDLVADLRAPTPSAAAEAAVQDGRVLLEALRSLPPRMARAFTESVRRRRGAATEVLTRLERGFQWVLEPRRQAVDRGSQGLERAVRARILARRQRLGAAGNTLDALSPLATLHRGYAVPLSPEGRVLRTVQSFDSAAAFVLRVADGRVGCRVLETHRDEEGRRDRGP
jgi:exodeoxyribonuclease VII large subunit